MDATIAIRSQYLAALEMLEGAVVACPEPMWNAAEDKNRFWHVAYHAVFWTHLYLQDTASSFVPWEKHRGQIGKLDSNDGTVEPYTKDEVLGYLAFCREIVDEKVPSLDLGAASGFVWLKFDKLELQFYNIRHLQHHVGELMERLGARAAIDAKWVFKG